MAAPKRDVGGARARMCVQHHVVVDARGPDRVVDGVVVRRLAHPPGGDHDPAQPVGGRPPDLGDRGFVIVQDRHERDADAPFRALGAQLREPAIVCLGAFHHEYGIAVARRAETGAERRSRHAAHSGCVGVREDHFARDAVTVELLVADVRVPRAAHPAVVLDLFAPLGDPLVARLRRPHARVAHVLGSRHELVVGVTELRIDVLAVLVGGKPRVTVRRDDEVLLAHHHSRYLY